MQEKAVFYRTCLPLLTVTPAMLLSIIVGLVQNPFLICGYGRIAYLGEHDCALLSKYTCSKLIDILLVQ